MPSTFTSSSSSASYSSITRNGQTQGHAEHHQSHTDPSGTTMQSITQNLGEPAVQETRQYDSAGRELPIAGAGAGMLGSGSSDGGRIKEVTEGQEESEVDQQYRERMEDEYAKREGGA